MLLSRDELKEVSGKHRPDAIRRWLDDQRIPYLVGGDGWPKVARVVVELRLGAVTTKPATRLNLAGLK